MDHFGSSLFRGSDFITADVNVQQPEELEAIEDEKRRKEELQEMLKNAFDDLEDEDGQTVDSSYMNSALHNGYVERDDALQHNYVSRVDDKSQIWHRESQNEAEKHFEQTGTNKSKGTSYDYDSQLEVLYQVRLREVQRLHEELENVKKVTAEEKSIFSGQVTLLKTELEKAASLRKDIEQLLVGERGRVSELEKELKKMSKNFQESEKLRKNILNEKDAAEITIDDLQQRLASVENFYKTTDHRNFDHVLESIQMTHRKELLGLQRQLENVEKKLSAKETSYTKLEQQFLELQKIHETILIEKSDAVNNLTCSLKETEAKYEQLASDVPKLEMTIEHLKQENAGLHSKLAEMTEHVEEFREKLNDPEAEKKFMLIQQIETLREDNLKLKMELEEKEKNLEKEKKKAIDDYSKEYLKFHQEKITQMRQDIAENFNKKIAELEAKLEESYEIKELYTEACILKDKLSMQNDNMQKVNNQLTLECAHLKEQLAAIVAEKEHLSRICCAENSKSETEEEVHHLRRLLDKSKNDYHELENSFEIRYRNEICSLKTQIKQLENENHCWRQKFSCFKSKEKDITNKMAEKVRRITDLEEKCEKFQEELKQNCERQGVDLEQVKLSSEKQATELCVKHSEEIAKLRVEHAIEIENLKLSHQISLGKTENCIKKLAMEAFDDEVNKITAKYKNIFQQEILSMENYVLSSNEKIKRVVSSIELRSQKRSNEEENCVNLSDFEDLKVKYEDALRKLEELKSLKYKSKTELEKLQKKYENSRKAALYYRQLAEKRSQLLKEEKDGNSRIIKKIQKQIDTAIGEENMTPIEAI